MRFLEKYQKYLKIGISEIFKEANLNIKTVNVKQAWDLAVEDAKDFLSFNKEDINLIKSLGNMLGKTDVSGQLSEINLCIDFLDSQIEDAEQVCKKNEKMYRSLGSIAGLAIIIILF